jgi:hypothetical protein
MSGKGKIARLPFEIRQQLNARMRDGIPDVDTLAWLNGQPAVRAAIAGAGFGGGRKARPQVTAQNLSEYRAGAYAAWLAAQDRVEKVKVLAEFSIRLAEAAGRSPADLAADIAGGRILQVLEGLQDADLAKLLPALASLQDAHAKSLRAHTDKARLEVQRGALALDQRKFERQTADLFLKWYADKRAREIADGKDAQDVKMDRLITLFFGQPPTREGEAPAEPP